MRGVQASIFDSKIDDIGCPFVITRKRQPSFVTVSPDYLDSLEEAPDIFKDQDLFRSIESSHAEAERGERGCQLLAGAVDFVPQGLKCHTSQA
ncbi:MAG TPA: hypothetical protein VMU77_05005 [Acidimicrobiales bacterium]|nr:hypothetical protein [Acidimicrobiales bacterium]